MSVTKVWIGGKEVGIVDLETCFEEVKALRTTDAGVLEEEILRKVQAKNYIPSSMERMYREGLLEEYRVFTGAAERKGRQGACPEIRLYGSSCFRCEKLDEMVKDILSRAKVKADYLMVSDLREVAEAGVISTPAIKVNGRTIVAGQVPHIKQLEQMLMEAMSGIKEP